jgi:hypothetical protein
MFHRVRPLVFLPLLLCFLTAVGTPLLSAPSRRHVPIYEAMLFSGKPDLVGYGVRHIRIVDSHELWKPGGNTNAVPGGEELEKIVAGGPASGNLLVVDIEEWSLGAAQAAESIKKYILTLDRLRSAAPNWRLGLYGVLPERDYWRAIRPPKDPQYRDWQSDNDRAASIASHVDILFPSLYTFYPDQDGWVRYATANLREARRLAHGKPVYCFLWMQYHNSSDRAYQLLGADYWRRELETCQQFADGVVIWGGFTLTGGKFQPLPWEDNAPWWRATLEYLRS